MRGFIDRNNDLLFRDMKEVVCGARNPVVAATFPRQELTSMKRPVTAGMQFKLSLNALIDILIVKSPWYVRCIKPNHEKKNSVMNEPLVRHQVQRPSIVDR